MSSFDVAVTTEVTAAEVRFGPYVLAIEPADSAGFRLSVWPEAARQPAADLPQPVRQVILPQTWDPGAVRLGAEAVLNALLVIANDQPDAILHDATDRNPEHAEVAIGVTESAGPEGQEGIALYRVAREPREETHTAIMWLPDAAVGALEVFLQERRSRREAEARERVLVALARADAEVALKTLRDEQGFWLNESPDEPTPFDAAIAALAKALGEELWP